MSAGALRYGAVRAWTTRRCERVPVRPRRGAYADRKGPRRGVEADLRRLPPPAGGQDGAEFVPFDQVSDYDEYVDGLPREDGVRSFLQVARDRAAGGVAGDPPGRRHDPWRSAIDKNERVLKLIHEQARGLRGLGPLRARRRSAPVCAARSSPRAPTPTMCSPPRSIDGPVRRGDRRGRRPARASAREAGAGHVSRGREGARSRAGPCGGVRGCPGRSAGRPRWANSATWSESIAWASADALKAHGADVVVSGPRGAARVVIQHPAFEVEPWAIRETELDLERLAQTESVFALSNGHIGLRGNLDEGEPSGLPGTYLGGFCEPRPLPYAEAGYGEPEEGQAVVNVTNGKIIRLLVGDSPFDVRYGSCAATNACLIFAPACCAAAPSGPPRPISRCGSARRVWCRSPSAPIAAISYEVEPVDEAVRVVVQSELMANEELPALGRRPAGRPGVDARRSQASSTQQRRAGGPGPPHSGQRAARRRGDASRARRPREASDVDVEAFEDLARVLVAPRRSSPAQTLGWSSTSRTAGRASARRRRLLDQVSAALSRRTPPAGTDCLGAACVPRRVLGTRRRGDRRRSRTATGDPFRDVPRAAGRRARRAARDRRKGAHRLGLRRPHVLGHRDVRAPDAHLHAAAGRRDALRWRHQPSVTRAERARASWSSRAQPSRGGRSTARSARAIGRPEPVRFTSTRTSPPP